MSIHNGSAVHNEVSMIGAVVLVPVHRVCSVQHSGAVLPCTEPTVLQQDAEWFDSKRGRERRKGNDRPLPMNGHTSAWAAGRSELDADDEFEVTNAQNLTCDATSDIDFGHTAASSWSWL